MVSCAAAVIEMCAFYYIRFVYVAIKKLSFYWQTDLDEFILLDFFLFVYFSLYNILMNLKKILSVCYLFAVSLFDFDSMILTRFTQENLFVSLLSDVW